MIPAEEPKQIIILYNIFHFRNENQVFIFWTAEPPSQIFWSREKYAMFDNFFNWTYTYRQDAEVQRLYGFRKQIIDSVSKGTRVIDSLFKEKTELAVSLSW